MKAKKLVLCILLSVALVVTFIPVISFGEVVNNDDVSWTISQSGDEGDVSLEDGEAVLTVTPSFGDTQVKLTYQWQIYNDDEEDYVNLENQHGITCLVDKTGTYRCVVKDEADNEAYAIFYVYEGGGDDEYDFGDLPDPEDIDDIELNTNIDVTVSEDNPVVTFKFMPEEDGFYVFESFGNADPVGQVRTEEGIIDYDDDYDDSVDTNFKLIFYASANETYYLQAKGYNSSETMSFQVKAYNVPWIAYPTDDEDCTYEGSPVTLDVTVEGDYQNVKYNWYRNGKLIKADAEANMAVSQGGRYYCLVSDANRSEKVFFNVYLPDITKNNLQVSYDCWDDTAYVRELWDYSGDSDILLTKGNITIPSSVTFADGKARKVTYVDIFAPEMTSVTIPASVTYIEPGLGMKTCEWDDDYDEIKSYTLIPGFVIYGTNGTAAQTYAKKYGIKFRDLAAEAEAARQGTLDSKMPAVKISKPKAAKKAITVKWKKLNKKQLKKAAKIEVWVCTNNAFAKGATIEKTVSKKKASVKIKGLKKGTTYFAKVRAIKYVNGKKVVGKWSKIKKVKVKK